MSEFLCRQCGASIEYKPGSRSLECPYCGFLNPIPTTEEEVRELDMEEYLKKAESGSETIESRTVTCPGCGACVDLPENVEADECPFCGSQLRSKPSQKKTIRPNALLPFKVDRRQAEASFKEWLHKLWFAPNDLKKLAVVTGKLTGIYTPYWTFDAKTISVYSGERGDYYYQTRTVTKTDSKGKTYTTTERVRKTRWTRVHGTVFLDFDDVLVPAGRSLPEKLAEDLEPWDLHNLEAYQEEYLSGFRCESYTVDLKEGFIEARSKMDSRIRTAIRRDIGGDEQRIHSVNTQYDNVTFKHILLPVWISAYRYNKKVYRFLVNGRTGEVQGQRPWSIAKIILLVLVIALVVAGIYFLFMH